MLVKLTPGQDWDGSDVIIFSFSSSLLLLRVDDVLHQLDLLLLPALRGRQQHLDEEMRNKKRITTSQWTKKQKITGCSTFPKRKLDRSATIK